LGRRLGALLLATAAVVLALGIAGCGDDNEDSTGQTAPEQSAPQPVQQTQGGADNSGGANVRAQKVEILDYEFSPPSVTIATGGKITWLNQGQAPHDATADDDSFATGTIDPGKLKSATFKTPGTYTYICTIHPQMHGTIEVVG
jgi:plastocyanin